MVDYKPPYGQHRFVLPERYTAVLDLNEFDLTFSEDGLERRRHLWHEVTHQAYGWAVLLACYTTYNKGVWSEPAYRLVRLRKLSGWWRVLEHFNLKLPQMAGMLPAMGQAVRRAQ